MHILYCHHGYFPRVAGAEAMTYRIAAAMQQRGHSVKIVCQGSGSGIGEYTHDGLVISALPRLDLATLNAQLSRKPDIVHAVDAVWPDYLQAALGLARAWQVPFAITPASAASTWGDRALALAVCREASVVFVLTEAERAQFREYGVAASRLVLTGQGPQLAGKPDPGSFRSRYGIEGAMVLFLGRKVRFKGYKVLLEASAGVWSRYPRTSFVFIGPRWDDDCAEVFAAFADPRIIEIGMVDEFEKHSALAACDLLCLPSTADVFPLVYVEAWSCGKPVIASPFPGIEEIVHHEQDGLIVAAKPPALAGAIMWLLSNPGKRQALGAAGLARVEGQFNWNTVADRVEVAYTAICIP